VSSVTQQQISELLQAAAGEWSVKLKKEKENIIIHYAQPPASDYNNKRVSEPV
jgi:hypothetical protein